MTAPEKDPEDVVEPAQVEETAEPDSTAGGDPDAEETSKLIESLAQPISDDSPCGESVTYDEDFERIKDEIDKLSDHDFGLIADVSEKLLSEKTKDILVAAYLAVGLTKTQGLGGLSEGLGVFNMLCDRFWEDLFPPRKRMAARGSALQFFAERASTSLASLRPTEADRQPVEASLRRLRRLQEFTLAEMGDAAPVLSGLKRALKEVERRLPKEKSVAQATDSQTQEEESGSRPQASRSAPAEIGSNADATTAVTKAAAFLRETDRASAVPYRVLRALRWSQVKAEPPNEGGKTKLPPPPEQRRIYLTGLLEGGEPEKLVEEAEASFQAGSFHFWLDLQYLIAGAMSALGETYSEARKAVIEETAILLQRVPSMAGLTFSDGTPFAGEAARDWIGTEVPGVLSGGGRPAKVASPTTEEGEKLEEQQKEAAKKLQKGDLAGALAIMQEGADRDKSAKERFRRQLSLASLCMKGGRATVARPILENLDREIGTHGLDTWDPDLALEAWSKLYTCYQVITKAASTSDKASLKDDSEEIFEKICRLDASFALSLSGKK